MNTFHRQALAVAVLAAATLLLESALTRLLAVAQFYHFAFLVVSLALLGFGASGSFLGLISRLRGGDLLGEEGWRGGRWLSLSGAGFTISVALAYLVINLLPFDSYSIAWDGRQVLYFGLYYLALTLPFLFAGLGIGAALMFAAGRSHLIYTANLFGSALGALLAPFLLGLAGVPGAVLMSGLAGLTVASIYGTRTGAKKRGTRKQRPGMEGAARWGVRIIFAIGLTLFTALTFSNLRNQAPLGMTLSPYKSLANVRRYPGATIIFGRWNAISRVDVVANVGSRRLPGLSYQYGGALPQQIGLSLDADALQPITLLDAEEFEAAAYLPEALAFSLRPQAKVLVIEPAGGLGVLQALSGGAEEVTALVSNPLVPQAVTTTAADFDVFAHPRVKTVVETSRVFTRRDRTTYDVVFLPLTDAYRTVTSGAYGLGETYHLTVEAFEGSLARLKPEGLLVVTRWLQTPPSEELRLIATLTTALERRGVRAPRETLVAYRGIQTMTVWVQPQGWSAVELAAVRAFAEQRRFDLVWAPDITPAETNRFNRLPESVYYELANELLTTPERAAFYADYPFDIAPPTDDRPFFFHFFTWKQTPELLASLGHTWRPFGGSGYFVLLALLALAMVFSAILILLPFVASRPTQHQKISVPPRLSAPSVLAYFGLLGLAFLFVEIPLIQRWILLLGHPTYAFTLVVATLLTFSGLGSTFARAQWLPRRLAFAGLVLLALLTPFATAALSESILGWPALARGLAAISSMAPLAILMGLPFPLGLAWLEGQSPGLIPLAWAVNGCASVIASVLAALFSLSYGFTAVLLLGAGAYAGAFLLASRGH